MRSITENWNWYKSKQIEFWKSQVKFSLKVEEFYFKNFVSVCAGFEIWWCYLTISNCLAHWNYSSRKCSYPFQVSFWFPNNFVLTFWFLMKSVKIVWFPLQFLLQRLQRRMKRILRNFVIHWGPPSRYLVGTPERFFHFGTRLTWILQIRSFVWHLIKKWLEKKRVAND